MPDTSSSTSAPARKRFRLHIIPKVGEPYWGDARIGGFEYLSQASKRAQGLVLRGNVKAVVIYKDEFAVQLLIYRPETYVHIERI